MLPESRIIRFLKKHHVLTLATVAENMPWCANCFYAYMEDENCLVFTSDRDTKHIRDSAHQPLVAGSIVLETRVVGNIQGIQFRGIIAEPVGEMSGKAQSAFLRRFPYAALMETTLWTVKLYYIKLTDNRLGFGKKLIWELK